MTTIEEQLRQNMEAMQRRLEQITPPATKVEQYEADMLESDLRRLNKMLTRRDQRDGRTDAHHNED